MHNNLGIALAKQHRLEDAAVHFKKAIQLRPDFESARKNLDTVLLQKKSPPKKSQPSN
jgi:Flp pilus assembly protein TadD